MDEEEGRREGCEKEREKKERERSDGNNNGSKRKI